MFGFVFAFFGDNNGEEYCAGSSALSEISVEKPGCETGRSEERGRKGNGLWCGRMSELF